MDYTKGKLHPRHDRDYVRYFFLGPAAAPVTAEDKIKYIKQTGLTTPIHPASKFYACWEFVSGLLVMCVCVSVCLCVCSSNPTDLAYFAIGMCDVADS